MKKLIISIALLCFGVAVLAQSPNLMSYQAIIRNASNQLIVNAPIGVRVSILQGSATGTVVFRETYNPNPTTNSNGLLGLNIGSGVSVIGSFAQLNWSQGPYFVQVEADPSGGTNYSISSVSQLLSVPYALHAKTADVPGLPGPQGPIGLTGPQGVPGNDGAVGPQGPIGLTGPAGPQGPAGSNGAVGPQGPIGLTGPQGVPGNDGAVGPQGPIGLTGPQGVPGNDGAVGPQGPIGLTGPAGPQGPAGSNGAVGPQGPIGLTGPQGVPGNDGAVGLQGPIGLTGPQGPTGPQGSFPPGNQPGEMLYWNGTIWSNLASPNSQGQVLTYCNGTLTWAIGGICPGTITALTCASATNSGTLTQGTAASGVSSSVPYTGGNGGTHNGQTVSSTGVTGLTATLTAGTFASGADNLTYTITGTPASSGTASFALNIGGQTCTLTRTVNSGGQTGITAHSCGATNVHNPAKTYGTMTDQQGNTYRTIVIGTQEWMAENLKTSTYSNGDSIPNITDNAQWNGLTTGAWSYYNNDPQLECPFGKIYNWFVAGDTRNVCPQGWHVPSNADWEYIINYFGTGSFGPGGKMKSSGTQFWLSPNIGATNETGFSALPNGMRSSNGTFSDIGSYGYYWSTWSDHPSTRNRWEFRNSQTILAPFSVGIRDGYSIRCIKDYTPPTTGTINSLDCNNAGITGNLVVGYQANSVTSSVLYTNGNGGVHNGQIVESTGVTGLTATLSPGSFYPIVGSLIYTITGTPSSSGTASFALNIGGQTCTLVRTVNATTPPPASFPQGYVHCNPNNPTQIFDVTNPVTGVTWMDRNLGASQVATSSSDVNAFGDLFQWGRGSDGHQCRTSITTSLISSTDQPSHGNFIVLPSGSPGDWRNPQNNNLWQGVNGVNNPCPTGYRLPTDAEFNAEILSWYSNNALGAFNSPLKITMAGYRSWNGTISNTGTDCSYWSSTIFNSLSRRLTGPSTGYIGVGAFYRAHGGSVRCLKD